MQATQIHSVTYNAATRAFEARVSIVEDGEVFTYPCALRAPMDMDSTVAARRLVELARRQHSRGLRTPLAASGRHRLEDDDGSSYRRGDDGRPEVPMLTKQMARLAHPGPLGLTGRAQQLPRALPGWGGRGSPGTVPHNHRLPPAASAGQRAHEARNAVDPVRLDMLNPSALTGAPHLDPTSPLRQEDGSPFFGRGEEEGGEGEEETTEEGRTLFVKNLAWATTEDGLRDTFSQVRAPAASTPLLRRPQWFG